MSKMRKVKSARRLREIFKGRFGYEIPKLTKRSKIINEYFAKELKKNYVDWDYPRTWKIKLDTYNRLNDSWRNNFDFIVTTP